MNGIFQPLFGERPKKESEGITNLSPNLPPKLESKKEAMISQSEVPSTTAVKPKIIKNQLEGFISDNKIIIFVIIVAVILLLLAFMVYNQKKQDKEIAIMRKKLRKMK